MKTNRYTNSLNHKASDVKFLYTLQACVIKKSQSVPFFFSAKACSCVKAVILSNIVKKWLAGTNKEWWSW